MKSGVPWQVEGVRAHARDTAEEAARRAGMSVGAWLDTIILDSALHEGVDPRRSARPQDDAHPEENAVESEDARRRQAAWERYQDDAYADRTRSDARRRHAGHAHNGYPAGRPVPIPRTGGIADRRAAAAPFDRVLIEIAERQRTLDNFAPAVAGAGVVHAAPTSDPLPRSRTQELSGLEQQLRQINTRIATLGQPSGLDDAVTTLRADLAEIGLMLQEAMPRKAVEALEAEVRHLADRIDRTRDAGADAAAFTAIERGLAEVRDALRGLTPAENLLGADRAVQELSRKVDRLASNAQDPSTLRQIEGAINAMRGIVSHVASNDALERLSEEVRALARKVDHAASSSGAGSLSALEERIAMLADALEARNQRGQTVPDKLDALVQGLIDKIERIELMRGDHGGLGHLEDRIAKLVETTQDALELVHGALGHVVDRLEWIETDMRVRPARPPEAAPPAAASAHLDTNALATRAVPKSAVPASNPVPGSAAEPIEIAAVQTLRPSRPGPAERRPIEPQPPPDHPLEPGSGTARGRRAHSPMDRVIPDAGPGGAMPTVVPEPDGKSSFIAAARRAAQAAAGPTNGNPRARGEIASAAAGFATRAEKLRALIVGVAAVVLVLGSLQVARTFLSSGQEPDSPIPFGRIVAVAPALIAQPAPAAGSPPTVSGEVNGTESTTAATAPSEAERETTGSVAKPGQPASPPTPIRVPSASDKLPAAFGSVLRIAAANGDAGAQYEVALRYFEGRGVPQDPAEAAEWFERSARQGMAPAQFRLASLYEQGLGVARNLAESYKWFALAARAGDPDAVKKRDDVGASLDQQSLQAAWQEAQAFKAQPQPEGAMQGTSPAGGWDPAPSAAAPTKRKPPVGGPKPDLAPPRSAQ